MFQDYTDEIGKYLKKSNSDVSKSRYKSKHKHEYVDCVFIINERAHRGKYCKVCGKIRNILFFETEDDGENGRVFMNTEMILDKYKNLETIHIDSFEEKYIPLEEEKLE